MKLAIISDIHANIHALEAVWNDIQEQEPDTVYCLGDLVGYGAYPNEVVEFIREQGVQTIMGNYDQGVGFDLDDCGCAYQNLEEDRLGKESLLWSRKHTSASNKAFLQSLPVQIRLEAHHPGLLLVHGSPRKINEYLYENRPEATFERVAEIADTGILIFGHTHLPYQKSVGGTLFLNSGSVGKPKDGDPRAGYVTLEIVEGPRVEFRRVGYDVEAAAKAVVDSGLPAYFAASLRSGGT